MLYSCERPKFCYFYLDGIERETGTVTVASRVIRLGYNYKKYCV